MTENSRGSSGRGWVPIGGEVRLGPLPREKSLNFQVKMHGLIVFVIFVKKTILACRKRDRGESAPWRLKM